VISRAAYRVAEKAALGKKPKCRINVKIMPVDQQIPESRPKNDVRGMGLHGDALMTRAN